MVPTLLCERTVFKCRRKQASLIVGSLNATGRLFHAVGPATENARRPYVISLVANCHYFCMTGCDVMCRCHCAVRRTWLPTTQTAGRTAWQRASPSRAPSSSASSAMETRSLRHWTATTASCTRRSTSSPFSCSHPSPGNPSRMPGSHWLFLSSWHTLLERSHVHSRTLVFSRSCLLPCIWRTDVQWSQIQFSGSEPRVVGSSWRSFPVWWRLANCSSNCTVTVFVRSTACDVAKESQASFCC